MGGLQKNVRLSDDGRYYWHWDPAFLKQRPESDAKARGEEIKNNMLSASKRLTMPALLVRGRFSDVIVQEDVDRFLQLVPHAEFVDVKEAGHMVAGDNNDVFTDAIAEFLGRNSIGG
jgi:pimeloyl-ACP methyl ester carboxylesterase